MKKQSDAVARADATCDERAGQTIGACVELREAPRVAAEGERRLVRACRRMPRPTNSGRTSRREAIGVLDVASDC